MAKAVCLLILFSAGAIVPFVSTTPTVTPAENAAVKISSDVTLTCGFTADTESERKWYKTEVNADNLLPDGSNVASIPVTINTDKTELKISSATTDHADKYLCHTSESSTTDTKSSYLEILTPECAVTSDEATPEQLLFSCGATYSGDWKPELSFGATADDPTPGETGKNVTLTGKKAVSDVTAGSTWNCKATMQVSNFQNSVSVDSTKDNVEVPNICAWTLAAPSGLKIESAGTHDTLVTGDTLTCSASGTPSPTFAWTDGDGGELGSTAAYEVKAADVDKTLTCTASNAYGSSTATFPASTESTVPPAVTEITDAPVTGGSGTLKYFISVLMLTQLMSLTMLHFNVFM